MVAIDASRARRMAYSIVLWQAVTTAIAALVSWTMAGSLAARSALLGGGISTLASFAMAFLSFRRPTANAQVAVSGFYLGEAVKVVVVIVLFVLVLRTVKVSPLAMFAAYMATFLVYWVALANALPSLGNSGRESSGSSGRPGE